MSMIYIILFYLTLYIFPLMFMNLMYDIQSTPDKSDSQVTGKSVQLSEISDLSEIKNIMQIRHATRSVS